MMRRIAAQFSNDKCPFSNQRERLTIPVILWVVALCGVGLCYSGGTGEPNRPYQIADVNNLLELAADVNNYDKCFIMTADVNLAGYIFTTAVIAPDTIADISFQGTKFAGIFNGNDHTISNLTIDD